MCMYGGHVHIYTKYEVSMSNRLPCARGRCAQMLTMLMPMPMPMMDKEWLYKVLLVDKPNEPKIS